MNTEKIDVVGEEMKENTVIGRTKSGPLKIRKRDIDRMVVIK